MEVPRMAIRRLEAETALAKIHFPRDTGLLHPLKRAVDGGSANSMVVFVDEIDEIISADVPLLPEEHADDLVALAGSFPAGRPHAFEFR
jgi:hypothetical protein